MRKHKTCYTVDSETCTAGRFVRRNHPDFRVLHLPCSAHFSIRIPVVQSKECENGMSSAVVAFGVVGFEATVKQYGKRRAVRMVSLGTPLVTGID